MSRSIKAAIGVAAALGFAILFLVYIRTNDIVVLQPKGLIAQKEMALMFDTLILMLIVAIPILSLAAFFGYWYREGNLQAMYLPNWEHGVMAELVWWAIPFEIILILGALTWTSTHELEPTRPIVSEKEEIVIQVVALPWKWLFIYPEENVAIVNEVRFPEDRPVRFEITADAPMNSFWIPQLGGQIYAMTGMMTKLHLIADEPGTYRGLSANYSGDKFSSMNFDTIVGSQEEFDRWVISLKASSALLTKETYEHLREPGASSVTYYGEVEPQFFNTVIARFAPAIGLPSTHMH